MFAKNYGIEIKQDNYDINGFNRYPSDLLLEYNQCIEEGLDIEKYKTLFESVAALENGDIKNSMSDIIFDIVINAEMRKDYKYNEPSDLEGIKNLRINHSFEMNLPNENLMIKKIRGAWLGRAIGCLLGKPIEGIRSDELIPFLKETDNYPLHRYILSTDITSDTYKNINSGLEISPMPIRLTVCPLMMILIIQFLHSVLLKNLTVILKATMLQMHGLNISPFIRILQQRELLMLTSSIA